MHPILIFNLKFLFYQNQKEKKEEEEKMKMHSPLNG